MRSPSLFARRSRAGKGASIFAGRASRNTFRFASPPVSSRGRRLRVSGKGGASPAGGPPGDLFLEISVEKDPAFSREGQDLFVKVQIPFSGACLGTSVDVPTLEGKRGSKCPRGSRAEAASGSRGSGCRAKGGAKGDLYAVVEVAVPAETDRKQKELLEKLKKEGL